MKLLRDQKAVEGLQELIDNCIGNGKSLPEQRAVRKEDTSKKRIVQEMRLTSQIKEFEMDQVILDLGSDVNIFPNILGKEWESRCNSGLQFNYKW